MFRLAVLLLALPLAGGATLSDARVVLDHGRVSIHSRATPLSDILDRFAQATGAQVVYEAARPRQLVSVVIEAASPAEGIVQLLEGQGLNYALRLDPSGRNVEMLVVTGSAVAAGASSASTRTPRSFATAPPEDAFEMPPAGAEEPPDVAGAADPAGPAGTSIDEATTAGVAVPLPGVAPFAPASTEPTSPESTPSPSPAPEPPPPQPPAPASYPGAPPAPPPPVNPGPASYPR